MIDNVFNLISKLKDVEKQELIMTENDEFIIRDLYDEFDIGKKYSFKKWRSVVKSFQINEMKEVGECCIILADAIKKSK